MAVGVVRVRHMRMRVALRLVTVQVAVFADRHRIVHVPVVPIDPEGQRDPSNDG